MCRRRPGIRAPLYYLKGGTAIQNLKRNINLGFRVTKEEQEAIKNRMALAGSKNFQSYLLRMAMNGYIVNLDLSDVKECSRLLGNISGNINQIARRVNETQSIYSDDIADIRRGLDDIWRQQDMIIRKLTETLEDV